VTLTATSSVASEQDITIPLTLSGTALASEYTVSAESITITAGSTTGSVTITATEDDSDVEVMETIIFTYGTLVNGTTSETDITLNLQSDDNPEISSIAVAGDGSFAEDSSTTVTMTIDSPSSINVNLPVTITGTATEGADYTSSFPSLGQEKLLSTFNSNYSNSDILQDGRIVAINSTQLRVYDPSTDQTTNVSLSNNYNYLEVSGNTIYSTSQNGNINSLYLIDISDLAAVTETIQVSLPADNSFNM
jgi:small nuclear ribonucleoprotein (snRNP)-like protein